MNERELISLKLNALDSADLRLDELLSAGKINAGQHEALTRENMAKRDRLATRREKLVATGSGVTPVIDAGRVARLREAVRQLQIQNASEVAVRALLQEILTAAEAAGDAAADDPTGNDAPTGAFLNETIRSAEPLPIFLALAGGVVLGLLLARLAVRPQLGGPMPETRLTLPISDPLPADVSGASAEDKLRVEFLDASGARIGEQVEIETPERDFVEGRGMDGGLAWFPTTPSAALATNVPPETAVVRVTRFGSVDAFALSDVTDPILRLPDARRSFPAPGKHWVLAVVSERFADPESFFGAAASLYAFIAGQAPFGESGVSFGMEALFWSSDPVTGLFGASDNRLSNGRVLQGKGNQVRSFVGNAGVDPQKILVIVNSGLRAGAGGRGRTIPSWTTITGATNEPWEAIALHELGHAFGLADEYDSRYDLDEPNPLEPNVTKESDPARTSWHLLANVAVPPTPTARRGEEGAHPPDAIGTFQGARYREHDRYRPSPNCRMRVTTAPFCKVCQDHIRRGLLA